MSMSSRGCCLKLSVNANSSSSIVLLPVVTTKGATSSTTGSSSNNTMSPSKIIQHTCPTGSGRSIATTIGRCRLLTTTTTTTTTATSVSAKVDGTESTKRFYSPIYVAATRQHVGKTTTSLALLNGLMERFPKDRVGFMKPVGQQSVTVRIDNDDGDGGMTTKEIMVDKDAALVKQYFQLSHVSYEHISPVLIPAGYTRNFLDGKITSDDQIACIQNAYQSIQSCSDIVLCEGTGHVAVGSIVDASNADIASFLNAKIVLVANGGLGNTYDELELNRNLCHKSNVDIAGVIINKVNPDKYDQTKEYLTKALQQKWGSYGNIPMLGCIPDRPFLGCPALADLERLFDATVISGSQHRLRHYRIQDLMLVATSLDVFLRTLRQNRQDKKRTLYVCHASRNDILLGYLMESVQRNRQHQLKHQYHGHSSNTTTLSVNGTGENSSESFETAMIVTGCADHPISSQVLEIVMNLPETAPPVLMTERRTDIVMQGIYKYTPKLNNEDSNRVERAVEHYQPYIDFDLLLDRVAIK